MQGQKKILTDEMLSFDFPKRCEEINERLLLFYPKTKGDYILRKTLGINQVYQITSLRTSKSDVKIINDNIIYVHELLEAWKILTKEELSIVV